MYLAFNAYLYICLYVQDEFILLIRMNIEDFNTSKPLGQRLLVTADNSQELFPVVDEAGNVLDSMTRAEAHCGTMRLHPVVHLHVYDKQGRLYLQHRATWKEVQPDKWDTATGGHVDYGETVAEALQREVMEELGMQPHSYVPRFLKKYVYQSSIERELVYIFTTTYDGTPQPSATETSGGRFWTADEIRSAIGRGILTPMFEKEYINAAL